MLGPVNYRQRASDVERKIARLGSEQVIVEGLRSTRDSDLLRRPSPFPIQVSVTSPSLERPLQDSKGFLSIRMRLVC
jgi:hypothetical protein